MIALVTGPKKLKDGIVKRSVGGIGGRKRHAFLGSLHLRVLASLVCVLAYRRRRAHGPTKLSQPSNQTGRLSWGSATMVPTVTMKIKLSLT